MKKIKNFYRWFTDPKGAGKYAGRITMGIFAVCFISMFAIFKMSAIQASATDGVQTTGDEINSVRMASVEYVYTFDADVDAETKEVITDYIYNTVDAVKLLHMVNMRQHVVFGNYEVIYSTEDTIYCPVDASVEELEEAINNLP